MVLLLVLYYCYELTLFPPEGSAHEVLKAIEGSGETHAPYGETHACTHSLLPVSSILRAEALFQKELLLSVTRLSLNVSLTSGVFG